MEALVGPDGVIRGPAGDGAVAAVARADVARSATAILAAPDAHVDRTYLLTGPQALTLTEVAAEISGARGVGVTFHEETVAEAYASRRDFGASDWQAVAWVSTYTAIKCGALAAVSGDVAAITGTRPMSLGDFLRAHPHGRKRRSQSRPRLDG